MNTTTTALTILCYGDSNTYGQKPDKSGRYAADVRWTGRLQMLLGDAYYVIEEGLNSRTTNLDYSKPGRNGKAYLVPCLLSHNPIDAIVLMLGTNDLKIEFGRSAGDVANGLRSLVEDIKQFAWNAQQASPDVILVSPIYIDDTAKKFEERYLGLYDHNSAIKSRALAVEINKVANENGFTYVDASSVARAGEDGVHFDEPSHHNLANLLAKTVGHYILDTP